MTKPNVLTTDSPRTLSATLLVRQRIGWSCGSKRADRFLHGDLPQASTVASVSYAIPAVASWLSRYRRIWIEAAAPSPTAEASCFVDPARTSPAAKTPGMDVKIILPRDLAEEL